MSGKYLRGVEPVTSQNHGLSPVRPSKHSTLEITRACLVRPDSLQANDPQSTISLPSFTDSRPVRVLMDYQRDRPQAQVRQTRWSCSIFTCWLAGNSLVVSWTLPSRNIARSRYMPPRKLATSCIAHCPQKIPTEDSCSHALASSRLGKQGKGSVFRQVGEARTKRLIDAQSKSHTGTCHFGIISLEPVEPYKPPRLTSWSPFAVKDH